MLTSKHVVVVLMVVGTLCGSPPRAEDKAPRRSVETFGADLPAPAALQPQIEFWKQVFGTYSEHQVVLHDTDDLRRIYVVLDFSQLQGTGMSPEEIANAEHESIEAERESLRATLVRLHQAGPHPQELSDRERRLWKLFRDVKEPDALLHAAEKERIRAQRGLRERFSRGIAMSRRYMPEIEAIFREQGVPAGLTRLPLVESCFNVHAYSKVGAAGVWQFMPATARLYMRVDDEVDERRDPVIAARAAARYLRRAYDSLGAWPLAITAYNHGPDGVARAVGMLGTTDIAAIIQRYNGPAFRFASRNFYTEFLAALWVDTRYRDYFGDLDLERPVPTETVRFPQYVSLDTVAQSTGLSSADLLELNPALAGAIRNGKLRVPRDYALRVPRGTAAVALAHYENLPSDRKFSRQRSLYVVHKVKKGQTLSHIAKRYNTTVGTIRTVNRLNTGHVRVGQALKIPTG